MKAKIILLLSISLFFGCQKTKKTPIPLFDLVENSESGSVTMSNDAGGNALVQSAPAEELDLSDGLQNSNSDEFLLEEQNDETIAVTNTDPIDNKSIQDVVPKASVEIDKDASTDFTYQTTATFPVDSMIRDQDGNILPGVLIIITDANPNNLEPNVIFQGVADSEGRVTGTITVNTSIEQVEATVTIGKEVSKPVAIPLYITTNVECQTSETCQQKKPISKIGDITIPLQNITTEIAEDADNDGVDNLNDFYPEDSSKAAKIRFPVQGVNTIAYEDLYPSAGDADLNDYVIHFFMEEELNASGKIVEIRGSYQHVARGAGYKHTLNLRLPVDLSLTYETTITDADGNDTGNGLTAFQPTAEQIQNGLLILGASNQTISSSNSWPGQTYKAGHIAKISIKFNEPVSRQKLGAAPYDIFIKILSRKIDSRYPVDAPRALTDSPQYYEVHFPGIYKKETGEDIYLDKNGFPWVVIVPGAWSWPYEKTDIRKADETGYPDFQKWAESGGNLYKEWYKNQISDKVFPADKTSKLVAYLNQYDAGKTIIIFASFISLSLFVLMLRKRSQES